MPYKSTLKLFMNVCMCLIFIQMGHAQEFNFRHFSLTDGLPTNEVYHVMQDSKGYMWVSTDYGVCRYNGQEFELFTTANGLFSNITFECFEDSNGKIWMRSMSSKGLVYYENDSLHQLYFNDVIQGELKVSRVRLIEAMAEHNGFLYLNMGRLGVMSLLLNNVTKQRTVSINDFKSENLSYITPGKHQIKLNHVISDWDNFINKKNITTAVISDRYYSGAARKPCLLTADSSYILMHDNSLLLIKNNRIAQVVKLAPKIWSLSLSKTNVLYVGTSNGLYSFNANDLSVFMPPIFIDKMISSAFVDREKGLWVTTLNEGLFYISNTSLIKNNKPVNNTNNHYVKCFLQRDNKLTKEKELLVGYYENSLDIINSRGVTHIPIQYDWRSVFSLAAIDENTSLGTGSFKSSPMLTSDNQLVTTKVFKTRYVAAYQDTFYIVGMNSIFKVVDDQNIEVAGILGKITSLNSTAKGLFVGGLGKLFYYHNNQVVELLEGQIKGEVLQVQYSKQGIIWVATKGSGLFSIKDNGETTHFTTANGLISNYCSAICFDDRGFIWVGTNKGVQYFKENEYPTKQVFSTYDGLISNNVTALINFKNNIWAGTTSGITVIDPQDISTPSSEIPLKIKGIVVNDTLTLSSIGDQHLNYQQNTISFQFLGLSYVNPEQTFKYRLIGLDTNWVTTTATSIRFPQLSPGKYAFELNALNHRGVWNKKPLVHSFYISPAFWQTNLFYISVALAILGITLIFLGKKFKSIHAKNELNESLLLARQQALNAQMNPHFVFNVLNSINSYVLENKALDASKYLTKFAGLIRSTLENSFKDMVSLSDELKMVENYIALERIRFNGEFSFQVTISPEIDPDDLFIPPLILQPFLENSLWHGLAGRKSGGVIQIKISKPERPIQITIEDNGIGRVMANVRKNKKDNPSRGMMITNQRLLLAKKRFKNDFVLHTEDLYHNDKSSAGTRVNLWLSLKQID